MASYNGLGGSVWVAVPSTVVDEDDGGCAGVWTLSRLYGSELEPAVLAVRTPSVLGGSRRLLLGGMAASLTDVLWRKVVTISTICLRRSGMARSCWSLLLPVC